MQRNKRAAAEMATYMAQEQLCTLGRGERQDQAASERASYQRTPAKPHAKPKRPSNTSVTSTQTVQHTVPATRPHIETTIIEGNPGEPDVTFRAAVRKPTNAPRKQPEDTPTMLPPSSIRMLAQPPSSPH